MAAFSEESLPSKRGTDEEQARLTASWWLDRAHKIARYISLPGKLDESAGRLRSWQKGEHEELGEGEE